MATTRRKPTPRAITPHYPTLSAERAATAGDRHAVEFDGPRDAEGNLGFDMVIGIRDRETGNFDARPGMTRSAVYAEVARLNAGLPVSRESQGIGRKPRNLVTRPDGTLTAAGWVEFLMDVKETRAELSKWIDTGHQPSLNDVHWLMTHRDRDGGLDLTKYPRFQSPAAVAFERLVPEQRRLVVSVAKQLQRVLGIRLKDTRNTWRSAKKHTT